MREKKPSAMAYSMRTIAVPVRKVDASRSGPHYDVVLVITRFENPTMTVAFHPAVSGGAVTRASDVIRFLAQPEWPRRHVVTWVNQIQDLVRFSIESRSGSLWEMVMKVCRENGLQPIEEHY